MPEHLRPRDLIFRGHGFIGWLFTSNPFIVAATWFVLAIALLWLPAHAIGLWHVRTADGNEYGFFHQYHWSLFYPVLMPILLALGILAFRWMTISVYALIEDNGTSRLPVIVDRHGSPAVRYPDYLSKQLSAGAGWIEAIAAVTAVAITAIDTADLWPGFFNGGNFFSTRKYDWDTAFRIPGAQPVVGKWNNFGFDVAAYTFQTAIIFLGLVFLIKYWMFLRIMIQVIDKERPPFAFRPWASDLYHRLGLKPLAPVFNFFLAVVVIYQAYAFYHRIELIDQHRGDRSRTYLCELVAQVKAAGQKDTGNPSEHSYSKQFVELVIKLPVRSYALKELAVPSSWLPIVFTVPAVLLVCLLPIGRLFFYLQRERRSLIEDNNAKRTALINQGLTAEAGVIDRKIKELEETTIWPNGSLAGTLFLVLMIALLVGTIAPPWIAWGLASGGLVKLALWLKGRLSAHSR